jgi:hypothetical protein
MLAQYFFNILVLNDKNLTKCLKFLQNRGNQINLNGQKGFSHSNLRPLKKRHFLTPFKMADAQDRLQEGDERDHIHAEMAHATDKKTLKHWVKRGLELASIGVVALPTLAAQVEKAQAQSDPVQMASAASSLNSASETLTDADDPFAALIKEVEEDPFASILEADEPTEKAYTEEQRKQLALLTQMAQESEATGEASLAAADAAEVRSDRLKIEAAQAVAEAAAVKELAQTADELLKDVEAMINN